MADLKWTVVRYFNNTNDAPEGIVTFDGVTSATLVDGSLVLSSGNTVLGVFAAGAWVAAYRDSAMTGATTADG
ncbi:hypothetical protein [uncultured Cellulomonas sp.]|uniref:hypothetical protein n=1 Tax=uncultured Cellulomonas sp. TaxID=189682 RepID=UPI00262EA112|nr:hypothetical protein [uncultured Cellulomonas sp.]